MIAPQNVIVPFLTFAQISAVRYSGMGEDSGIVSARFQLDVIAATSASLLAVKTQAKLAMQRFRNAVSSPAVIDTHIDDLSNLYEDTTDLCRGVFDVLVHHRE